jgi:hypothetical protein
MADRVKQYSLVPQLISIDSKDIPYEMHFTRDKGFINQYKQLRQSLYDIDPKFVGFRIFSHTSTENYEDPDNQMLILHNGKECYGGVCVRMSMPQRPVILEIEQDILPPSGKFCFSLRERFPELELNKYAYAEIGRFALRPDMCTNSIIKEMHLSTMQRCLDYRVRYFFTLSDKVRTRLYKRIYANAGVLCTIRHDLDIPMRPEYEGLKMHLLVGDMKKLYVVPSDSNADHLFEPFSDFEFN